MTITLNLEKHTYPEALLSVAEILGRKRWTFPLIIIKVNGILVPREGYGSALVQDGDEMEAYHLVSGG